MRLSNTAQLALKGTPAKFKEKLASEFKVHIASIYSWIRDNAVNGPLTKTRAVQMISEETGLAVDKILEESKKKRNVA